MTENDVLCPLIAFDYISHVFTTRTYHQVKSNMAFVVLAALVAQVEGIKFYNRCRSGVCRGERVFVVRQLDVYNANCLDVRLAKGECYWDI